MNQLAGKVAIVTGASSGIGRATARLYAQEGAQVILAARRQLELESLVTEISATGGQATALAGDVSEESYSNALVDLAIRSYGGLDIAFNNAAIMEGATPTHELTSEQWEEGIRVNLTGAFFGAKYQIPAMLIRGVGSVIFTSSVVGTRIGLPGFACYATSKAGLVGLAQSLAAEYGPRGIRVNTLLPGPTETPMGKAHLSTPESLAFVRGLPALKRLACPEEIASSALYLASDASSFVTGTTLLADGGVSINRT